MTVRTPRACNSASKARDSGRGGSLIAISPMTVKLPADPASRSASVRIAA
jgi:hypothetical protein